MAWRFPETLFDLVCDGAEFINCRLVALDGDHVTVDRDWVMGLGRTTRLRTQVRLDLIRSVHEHAVGSGAELSGARGDRSDEERHPRQW